MMAMLTVDRTMRSMAEEPMQFLRFHDWRKVDAGSEMEFLPWATKEMRHWSRDRYISSLFKRKMLLWFALPWNESMSVLDQTRNLGHWSYDLWLSSVCVRWVLDHGVVAGTLYVSEACFMFLYSRGVKICPVTAEQESLFYLVASFKSPGFYHSTQSWKWVLLAFDYQVEHCQLSEKKWPWRVQAAVYGSYHFPYHSGFHADDSYLSMEVISAILDRQDMGCEVNCKQDWIACDSCWCPTERNWKRDICISIKGNLNTALNHTEQAPTSRPRNDDWDSICSRPAP
jgi:hypothetical protein